MNEEKIIQELSTFKIVTLDREIDISEEIDMGLESNVIYCSTVDEKAMVKYKGISAGVDGAEGIENIIEALAYIIVTE